MSAVEEDGFVLISKDGLTSDEQEADIVSLASSKSSLCVVDDPSRCEALLHDDDYEQLEGGESKSDGTDVPALAPRKEDTQEELASPPAESGPVAPVNSPAEAVPQRQPKYVCLGCNCDVAAQTDLVWEGFMGANKSALLFSKVLNTEPAGEPRKQQLSTGLFLLQDVRCRTCSIPLGWSYLRAWNQEQQYKEGSTILQQGLLALEKECDRRIQH